MAAFADLCRFTPTLGGTTDFVYSSAVGGCQSPALAGVVNGIKYKLYAVSADLTQWEIFEGAYNSGTATFPRTTVLYNSLGTGTATGQSGAGTKINFSTVPQVAIVGLAEDIGYIPKQSDFGGRLTALSGVPVPTVDVVGSQNLYYAPFNGKSVPTYQNGVWQLVPFTSGSTDQVGWTLGLAGSANWAADSIHDVFAVIDSGTPKLATRLWDASMLPAADTLIAPNVTITTGTGATAWANSTNAFNGTTSQPSAICAIVTPSNTGTANFLGQDWGVGVTKVISKVVAYGPSDGTILGIGPAAGTFVVYGSNDNTNWHKMAIWRGNDTANATVFTIPISITEQLPYRYHRIDFDGDAVHAVRVAQVQFYQKTPATTRRLTLRDGILVNDASMTARTGAATTITTAQYEGVYLGTIHIDTATAGQISTHVTYGPSRTYGVWNCYNRRKIKLLAGTYNTLDSYAPVSTQLWNACESASSGTTFSLQAVCGMAEEWISADLTRSIYLNCVSNPASYECGIAVDTTLNFSGAEGSCNIDNTGQAIGFLPRAWVSVPPFAGIHTLTAIERQGNSGTGPQSSFTGPRSTQLVAEWMG